MTDALFVCQKYSHVLLLLMISVKPETDLSQV